MFFQRNGFTYLSYKALYSFQTLQTFILFRILDPLFYYLLFATLATAIAGRDYLGYVLLGNIVFYVGRNMMLNYLGMFRNERQYGTLELNVAAPMSTFLLLFRKSVVPLLDSVFVFILGLLIGKMIFNVSVPIYQWGNLILLIVVTMFSLLSFSLVFACLSLLFSNVNLFSNLSISVLHVLCGVSFSVAFLPPSMEAVARLLPMTHSIEAIRTIYGIESFPIWNLLAREFIIGGSYLFVAFVIVNVMERLARRTGALFKNV